MYIQLYIETTLIPHPGEGVCGEIGNADDDQFKSKQTELGEHPWVAALAYHSICM